jgi:hypothetical protein
MQNYSRLPQTGSNAAARHAAAIEAVEENAH